MYPGRHAAQNPDKAAAILAETGETLTYGELERRSAALAHVLHDAGLRRGDVVALLTENHLRAFEVYWAAIRSGLYLTAVNYHLSAAETGYIVRDSGARALIISAAQAEAGRAILDEVAPEARLRLAFGGAAEGYASYEDAIAAAPDTPLARQPRGATMLYSSGTTGRPKGVRTELPAEQITDGPDGLALLVEQVFGVTSESVYLSPAPIYHAAPLRWTGAVQAIGGTVIMMTRFDAERALAMIERYRVDSGQFVPTMFVRMLQLPGRCSARCTSAPTTAPNWGRARSARSTSRPRRSRSATTTRRRRPGPRSTPRTRTGAAWGISATPTATGSCISPTASTS
jgi:fatty-acyl-CoA synthase